MELWLGVDTGGTFTDFVLVGEEAGPRIHKVLSTPRAPEEAILQGIREMGLEPAMTAGRLGIVHGTTVATNAVLEGKGAHTVFVTNEGLEDVLLIGRQTRERLYELCPGPAADALDRDSMLGVAGRTGAGGEEVQALSDTEIRRLVDRVEALGPQAVAISLLFGWLEDDHEKRLAEALEAPGRFVCRASSLLPVAGEYERGMATWLNAWLGPVVSEYLERLRAAVAPAPLSVMQSHGGTSAARTAASRAVHLLLSGPAGGLCAARALGEQLGEPRQLTFDMGGTSTDVALIDGDFRLTREGRIGPWPVAVPMVEMHTIGAGGGSLARVDAAGMLHVGPESAGADPGPACYGRGGTEPTVTDANLWLGRLPVDQALGGSLRPDRAAAGRALERLGLDADEAARGVIDLANEHMAQALRVISVQKGHDPADFVLTSFGGAGGLHVCELASMLGMTRALVPRNSGVLSAEGLVRAPRQRELIRALPPRAKTADIEAVAVDLAAEGRAALREEGVSGEPGTDVELELCYRGQSFQLAVPWQGDPEGAEETFHALHEQRYGHRLGLPVERVQVRVRVQSPHSLPPVPGIARGEALPAARVRVSGCPDPVPVFDRHALGAGQKMEGPLLVREPVATTWVAPEWRMQVLEQGHLWLELRDLS